MTKPKFKNGDRVLYTIAGAKREVKVLMVNSAVQPYQARPFYDISIEGDVYTVHESYLRSIMSDPQIAKQIATGYQQAQEGIAEARAALKRAKYQMEQDGQPDYQLRMLDEFDIVLKNTLRFELTAEVNRWSDIAVERKKG